jgi:hypothetical protein
MPARPLASVVPAERSSVADETARAIAWALREGFDRHYALFRARAAAGIETGTGARCAMWPTTASTTIGGS